MGDRLYSMLNAWDFSAWMYLHSVWRSPVLDLVMPFLRNPVFWAPLYLFLIAFMPANYGKKGWIWCAAFLLCFGLCDYTSASIIKPLVQRARPCNVPELEQYLHLIVPRSSGYSFPSSHAANHFGLGVFMALTIGRRFRWVRYASIAWAFLVAYAQVYSGVHYPFDVLVGGLLGAGIGLLVAWIYNTRVQGIPVVKRITLHTK